MNTQATPIINTTERTRLTIHLLILPVMALFAGLYLANRTELLAEALSLSFLYLWIATTLVCFVRGFIILRQHRYLALACFAVSLGQVGLAVVFSIIPHWRSFFQL